MNESMVMMVKALIRGAIIAILTMNLLENFEISTIGYSMIIYALTMKDVNVSDRRMENT